LKLLVHTYLVAENSMQGAEKKRGKNTGGKSQPKTAKKKAPSSKRAKPKK